MVTRQMPVSETGAFHPPSDDCAWTGADARRFFEARGIPLVMVADSKMKGGGAALVITGGNFTAVRLSKRIDPSSELGQWCLWHEAGPVEDDIRVARYGRFRHRTGNHCDAFAAHFTYEQREEIARLLPLEVRVAVRLTDGSRKEFGSVAEVESEQSLTLARRAQVATSMKEAQWKMVIYRMLPSEIFAEAVACRVLRPAYFRARYPAADDWLKRVLPWCT